MRELVQLEDIDMENMTQRMKILFIKHIGRDKSITRRKLFSHFFGSLDNYNDYQLAYLFQRLYGVICYLRRNTKFFIIADRNKNDYIFFLIKTRKDANIYLKKTNDYIKGMKKMQKKALRSADNKWYVQCIKEVKKKSLNA